MPAPLTDAELLARRHRRRRWIVAMSLASIPLLLAVIVAVLVLRSSGITIEEASAIYESLDKKSNKAQVERLLGSPFCQGTTLDGYQSYTWLFVRQSLHTIEFFNVMLYTQNEEKGCILGYSDGTVTGWDAWKFRWLLLKQRLGINVDE